MKITGAPHRRRAIPTLPAGVEDLAAALDVVQRETGRAKVHMFGESSGAIRAGAFAQQAPDRVERLILTAFTYKGEGAAEIARRRARIEELRANPKRKRDAAMIRSIFSRDGHPNLYEPAMADALVRTEMQYGDAVPSGTYIGGEPAAGRSGQSARPGPDDARRMGRQCHRR